MLFYTAMLVPVRSIGQYSASDVGTDELHHFRHILSVYE